MSEDTEDTRTAEDVATDFIFGAEDEPTKEVDEEYEAGQEPVVEGDESEEPSEEPADDLVEVKWEGQLIEAPKAVADALMRQSDYTQKTQEVSTQRKELEMRLELVERTDQQYKFAESIRGDISKAQQAEAQAEQIHQYMRDNLDDLTHTDIEKLRMAIEDKRKERDEVVQSLQGKQNEFQQAQEQSHVEILKQGTEVLKGKIQGWGESHQKQVRDYALDLGFTEQEIGQVLDPRQVETLWKASQYDALQAGKKPAVLKAQSAIKSKSRNPMPKDTQDKLNLRKKLKSNKLSNRDKADLVGDSLARRFNM